MICKLTETSGCKLIFSICSFLCLILGFKKIFLRSDNAGCYHNKSLIAVADLIAQNCSMKVSRYDFCEPQTGKDICDRKISVLKRAISRYIDSGYDVTNAVELKNALDSRNLEGTYVYVCPEQEIDFKEDFNFNLISTYNSFVYHDDYLVAYKYNNIGNGEKFYYKNLLKKGRDKINNKIKLMKITENIENNNTFFKVINKNSNVKIYKCEHCDFIVDEKNLLSQHNTQYHLSKNKQIDNIKLKYAGLCINVRKQFVVSQQNYKTTEIYNQNTLNIGFAIKSRVLVRFTVDQIKFMTDEFNKGVKDKKNKSCPLETEKKMLLLHINKGLYRPEELLSQSQIKSYFSKLYGLQKTDGKKSSLLTYEKDAVFFEPDRDFETSEHLKDFYFDAKKQC